MTVPSPPAPALALCAVLLAGCGARGCSGSPDDDTGPSTVEDSLTDSASGPGPIPGQADFSCPITDGVEELAIEVQLRELDDLHGHGWAVELHTEEPALATVFFGASDAVSPCHQALSTGWYLQDHSLALTNLRLDRDYQLVVKLEYQDGTAERSPVVQLRTQATVQPLASGYADVMVEQGSAFVDAEIHGEVPRDLVLATSLGFCGVDFGGPSTATHVQLFDFEGYLVGHYSASDEVQGFSQNLATVTGSPGWVTGNQDVRLDLGGGIPERARVSVFDLPGGVERYLEQPSLADDAYTLGYADLVVEDTSGLALAGVDFLGRAHLALRSTKEDGQPRTEVFFWDEGLVTEDNVLEPEAWTVWGYLTAELTDHPQIPTPCNSVDYDPVRNELVLHTHGAFGGLLWGLDLVEREVTWVFGERASELLGSVPDDAILLEAVADPGLCDDPIFARGHGLSVWHGAHDGPSGFYVGLHDNGGDDYGRRQHSRAIVYRIDLDQSTVAVDWAYPSNPLEPDDPFYDSMAVFSHTHGGLSPVPGHDGLFLLTQGSGYCYEEPNELGLVNREHMVLLRALPQEHSAEVLAIYAPGSDDFARLTLYAATPTRLYAPICEDQASSGRRVFEVSALGDD